MSTPESIAFWTKSPEAVALEGEPVWKRAGVRSMEETAPLLPSDYVRVFRVAWVGPGEIAMEFEREDGTTVNMYTTPRTAQHIAGDLLAACDSSSELDTEL